MSIPACRACGFPYTTLRGRKRGRFIPRDFEFHECPECGLLFVEPFSGFEIYNDAYYRGAGPDPYVDYEAEYRDWRRSDRLLEFEDLFRLAGERLPAATIKDLRDQGTKGPRDFEARGLRDRAAIDESASGSGSSSPTLPLPSSPPLRLSVSPSADPLRWLDFGCGAGAFLKYLRERGHLAGRPLELTGHDVGSYAELLRTQDGFRILDLETLAAEPGASFDVVSMIEVIEHLPDPRAPLQLISRLLRPGGLLLLTTGNLDSPVARRQGIHYRYCAPEIHVSLFNPRCLSQLYRRAGLEPWSVRYQGAVRFKVLKTLRHHSLLRTLAATALTVPAVVRLIDWLYGVSAMPCAVKPRPPT